MKTLKESLLAGMEDTLVSGDDAIRNIETVFKQLKAYLSKASNWQKTGRGDYTRYSVGAGSFMNLEKIDGEQLRSLLQSLGFNGNHIYIALQPNQSPNNTLAPNPNRQFEHTYWALTLKITNSTEKIANDVVNGNVRAADLIKDQFIKTVYISQSKAKLFASVIKNYIKPAMNSIDSFKKFIDDIQNSKDDILDK